MSDEHFIQLGMRESWGEDQAFGLSARDRRQHLYAIGQTGSGKTTLLKNMIVQDILAGQGVGIIDPHGDLSEELLDCIPSWRVEDLVYFNPADAEYPVGFNLLKSTHPPHLVASGIVGALKSIWRDSWGPRLEYILYAAVAALLECQNVSLLGLQRMLTDSRYRHWVVKQVKDPMVKSYWLYEFENYGKSFVQEAIAPIQNKVGQLFMSPLLRNVLGQVKSKFDLRFMMDNRRIFIANISKGKIGEDKSNLLGALLVAQFQLAAMSRADTPEHERKDFFLFVDEFQSFTSDAFASILSEARKYRLCLTLSHQYIDQVRPEIRAAVFGNVGSMLSFGVGQSDAEVLAKQLGDSFAPSHFTRLPNYQVYAKILNHGERGEPFLGKTCPPLNARFGRRDKLVKSSRERYSKSQAKIEGKIEKWLN